MQPGAAKILLVFIVMLSIVRTKTFIWHGDDASDVDCDKDDHGGYDELHDATSTLFDNLQAVGCHCHCRMKTWSNI